MTERDENAELDELLDAEINKGAEDQDSTVQPEGAEAVEQAEETVQIPDELQPVSAWKEEARQAWESIAANQDYHDYLRNLRGQLDSDYQYRTQLEQERAELSQRAQVADQINQLAGQYADVFQGRNPTEVIGNYLYYAQQLQKDPQNTLQRLAKDYGIDLKQLVQDQPYVDEYTQKLQTQLEQVQRQMSEQQIAQQQAQARQQIESAKAFEFETDAEGNLLHPHVPKVATHMIALLKSGQAQDFKQAYETACWMNAEVRESLLKEQASSKEQQRKEQAARAKAAATAQPKPSKSSKSQPRGVEDLDDAMERAEKELSA
jgi:hypothetical protein